MDPDMYRIKVLKYLNPHLIWVEVIGKSEEIVFEQIGIYGILPLDTVLDFQGTFISARSEVWIPAAAVVMTNTLVDAEEIWFYPIHIDRRSSIFNNNIHKYGDIVVKKTDGTEKHMSKLLKNSGFAICDIPQFHQDLSVSRIRTKLTEAQARDVINELKKHYIKSHKNPPWEEWIQKHDYIFYVSQQLDILRHMRNGKDTKTELKKLQAIQNKLKDLDLCRDIDEESVGRGKTKSSCSRHSSPPSRLKLMKWKMRMVKGRSKYLDDTSSSTEAEFDGKLAHSTQNINSLDNSDTSLDESLAENERTHEQNKVEISGKDKNMDMLNDVANKYAEISRKAQKAIRCGPAANVRMAYGPPGFNLHTLTVKTIPRFVEELKKTNTQSEEINNITDRVQSNVLQVKSSAKNNGIHVPNIQNSKDCEMKPKTTKSLLLQRKLKQHKEKLSVQLDSSTSDTNTFEEPVKNKVNNDSSDDESISDLVGRLNLKTIKHDRKKEVSQNTLDRDPPKINANPFKNLDGSDSVFVEKLISTVLMVHTKKNNRIQPCSNIRDVPFTPDIQVVLRNMGVKVPTRLQTVSWTSILRGHSVFMIGPMGCGKTMGYLPAVCRLTSDSRKLNPDNVYPSCIIVCATAKSVSEVENYSKMLLGLEERVFACYVGMDELNMTTSLLNGCDLLVCTPPILARLLQADLGVDLRALTTFVIDDCERISEVYADEIKYILYEVKKVLKSRANKQLKVQFVVASRLWCKFLESLSKKAPDTIVCIGSFQECVLYSKTRMLVDFVKKENKVNAVLEFLIDIDGSKKTVIVCREDDEVDLLESTLTKLNRVVFACNNSMTIHDLYNLNIAWGNYEEPIMGPILICCDSNLAHLNITDAYYLVHYSMPRLFSTFSKRFSVLNDNYPSIFKDDDRRLKVKVMLEETNAEQLPKILNFVKRCTDVPEALNDVANTVLARRDVKKAQDLVPICDTLLSFGHCVDYWNCNLRHAILRDFDDPKEWMPMEGYIDFKILHYHSADLYSVRLLSNTVNGNVKKYPQTYSTLSLKMGMYFSKESNQRLHGIPKVGDVCAVSVKLNFFARCQVVKILDTYKDGNPNHVLLRLLDEEKYERSKDIHLFYLPNELKEVQTYVVQVRLANIQPRDKDVTYSDLAKNHIKRITDADDDLYVRGQVVSAVDNCVFVDSLEACQDLSSLNGTVVRYNLKQELLNAYAKSNPNHVITLEKLCHVLKHREKVTVEVDVPNSQTTLPQCRWAHLEGEDLSAIFLASAVNPHKFFVRLAKFSDCMDSLIKDINAYAKENPEPVKTFNNGDILLAEFPDDGMYERARIDDIYEDKVKCFFVDQGDWREVSTKKIMPITAKFITQMPFQAIECRLIGIKPAGEEWTEFCTHWFTDHCFEDSKGNIKLLYIKYFTKTEADSTGGHKYGVAIIDTNSEEDVIVNNYIVDLNLARINEDEIQYLKNLKFTDKSRELSDSESDVDEPTNAVVPFKRMMQRPIRSVPLVDSDNESDDIDRWAFNMDEDFIPLVNPNLGIRAPTESERTDNVSAANKDRRSDATEYNQMAIAPINHLAMIAHNNISIPVENKQDNHVEQNTTEVVANSEPTEPTKAVNLQKKDIFENFDDTQFRKPKLTWYQNKSSVIIKIHVIGAENYILDIKKRYLKFIAEQNDTKYGFVILLYGVLDLSDSSHANKGQYILVKLMKLMKKNWLTLARDGTLRKWIVYDIDCIDTSSSEEEEDNSGVLDTIKNLHDRDNSDSEDEEFADDVTYQYPK